jgi:tetratricopeptide (TPR) repeat protein
LPGTFTNRFREQTKIVCSFLLVFVVYIAGCAGGVQNKSAADGAQTSDPDSATADAEASPVPAKEDASEGESTQATLRAYGRSLFDQGQYDEAAKALESYDRRYPGEFEVNMELGYIYVQNGDHGAALPRYRIAVDANPKSVDARVALAKTLESLGRVDNAIRVYESAIELRGLTREMEPIIIAQANLLNQRGKYSRTLELIERAGDAFPETVGLSCARGMALAGEGRYDEAIAAFTRASGDPDWNDFANSQIRRIENLRSGH